MQSRPVPDRQAVRSSPPAEERRKPARDLIVAVLENMRRNLEPLRYSTLAPSRYVVYLHPIEYARLEGIVPLLQEQTMRALDEEIARINRRSPVRRSVARLFGEWHAPVQTAAGAWHVEFLPDPDGEIAEGDILIDSELLLPSPAEPGAGQRTRRITTMHTAARTTTRARTADMPPPLPQVQALARLTYDDDSGHHVFDIVRDSVTIGRGGVTYPVDVRIVSSVDVSREHARIRRDPRSNAFFLIDLSSLGTSLNGRHVPRGYDEVDGTKRENDVETPLPDQARISLADTVSLHFAVMRG